MQPIPKRDGFSMTEGKIGKQLLLFSLPIIAANLLQQAYVVVDTVVVGRFLGRDALAAVGSVGSMIYLVIGILVGLGAGVGIVAAQYFGAKETDRLKKTIHTAIVSSIIAGIVMAIVGNLTFPFLMGILNFPPYVAALSRQYLQIYFVGIIPMLLYNVSIGIIRAMGDSRRPLYYLLISGFLNLCLNLLFILVMGWGLVSVAWATVISQTLAAVLAILHLMRLDEAYRLRLRELRVDKAVLRRIVRLGLPLGVQTFFFSLPNLYIQSNINRFGAAAMAGVAASFQVYAFLYMIAIGLSMAVVTFVGQNAGARNVQRIREGARRAILIAFCGGLVTSLSILYFSRPLLGLFSADPEVIDFGMLMMLFTTPLFAFFATSEVLNAVIRGVGKTTQAMLITGLCIGGVRVVWLLIAMTLWDGIEVVFFAFPLSWVIYMTGSALYYRFGGWWRKVEAGTEISS